MIYPNNRYEFRTYRKKRARTIFIFIGILVLIAIGFGLWQVKPQLKNLLLSEETEQKKTVQELWDEKKYQDVIAVCEQRLQDNPLDSKSLIFAGFSYFYSSLSIGKEEKRQAQIEKAIVYLRKALLKKNPPLAEQINYVLGKSYYHKGKYFVDLSIQFLEKAYESGYIAEDIYEYLGLAYSKIEEYDKSIEYFKKAIDNSPSDLLYLTVGELYYKKENAKQAEEYLLRALNSTTDKEVEKKSRLLLGEIYREKEQYIKAEKQYKEILSFASDSADAHFYLGEIYNKLGNNVKARAEWRNALRINPDHYGAKLRLY